MITDDRKEEISTPTRNIVKILLQTRVPSNTIDETMTIYMYYYSILYYTYLDSCMSRYFYQIKLPSCQDIVRAISVLSYVKHYKILLYVLFILGMIL